MTPRAAAMAPEDRRRAIVSVLVPLIVERGGEVSTKDIAAAAGIAEGTIFRVFPDKRALMMAAAEEAINPADGQASFDAALAGVEDLRTKVVIAATRVTDRMRLTMAVMMAVHTHFHDIAEEERAKGGGAERMRPPAFVLQAQEDLHRRMTSLFEPHRDELAVEPAVAATALRSLIFGASRPELGMAPVLTPEQIAELVLGGVLRREHP